MAYWHTLISGTQPALLALVQSVLFQLSVCLHAFKKPSYDQQTAENDKIRGFKRNQMTMLSGYITREFKAPVVPPP